MPDALLDLAHPETDELFADVGPHAISSFPVTTALV